MSDKLRRRDTLTTMAQILEVTKEGILKTQIMYKANLSFNQLNDYVPFMLKNNLIARRTRGGKGIYVITPKGCEFLQLHGELLQLLKDRTQLSES